ncbi:hypothetical protein B0H21DRAFT_204087 [Amylocystis lapponica]|nr:hypothetical protein B0H21DRAFT_204087 [Amylocystis lapponica]
MATLDSFCTGGILERAKSDTAIIASRPLEPCNDRPARVWRCTQQQRLGNGQGSKIAECGRGPRWRSGQDAPNPLNGQHRLRRAQNSGENCLELWSSMPALYPVDAGEPKDRWRAGRRLLHGHELAAAGPCSKRKHATRRAERTPGARYTERFVDARRMAPAFAQRGAKQSKEREPGPVRHRRPKYARRGGGADEPTGGRRFCQRIGQERDRRLQKHAKKKCAPGLSGDSGVAVSPLAVP